MSYDFTTLCPAWGYESTMWEYLRSKGVSDPEVIDMGVAEMKFPLAPAIKAAVIEQAQNGSFGYPEPDDRFKNAVCGWMRDRHGWEISPDWLIQSYGLVPAIGYGVKAMTEPGDGVLVFYPSYAHFPPAATDNGRRLVKSELVIENGRYVMDFDDVEKKMSDPTLKAVIFCNPHNPTGRVWTRDELTRFCELCLRHGVKIISDDIHFDLVYAPNVHTPIASLSPELADVTITLTAPSKTFNIAGMTMSNSVISNAELRRRYQWILERDMGGYYNAFGFAACRAAYESGAAWLDEALAVLKGNCDYLRAFLSERIPRFSVLDQEGTYLCWMDCRDTGLSGAELDSFMLNARFMSQHGLDFGPQFDAHHRVNVACPREYLDLALCRLEEAAAALG